jgi:hypothetical protein
LQTLALDLQIGDLSKKWGVGRPVDSIGIRKHMRQLLTFFALGLFWCPLPAVAETYALTQRYLCEKTFAEMAARGGGASKQLSPNENRIARSVVSALLKDMQTKFKLPSPTQVANIDDGTYPIEFGPKRKKTHMISHPDKGRRWITSRSNSPENFYGRLARLQRMLEEPNAKNIQAVTIVGRDNIVEILKTIQGDGSATSAILASHTQAEFHSPTLTSVALRSSIAFLLATKATVNEMMMINPDADIREHLGAILVKAIPLAITFEGMANFITRFYATYDATSFDGEHAAARIFEISGALNNRNNKDPYPVYFQISEPWKENGEEKGRMHFLFRNGQTPTLTLMFESSAHEDAAKVVEGMLDPKYPEIMKLESQALQSWSVGQWAYWRSKWSQYQQTSSIRAGKVSDFLSQLRKPRRDSWDVPVVAQPQVLAPQPTQKESAPVATAEPISTVASPIPRATAGPPDQAWLEQTVQEWEKSLDEPSSEPK